MLAVAYCSRTLTGAEKHYAQKEKECLVSVWTCEKLSRYLYGLESFKVLTDHKPLVPLINQKTLDEVPIRCQRLLIRMMRFNPLAVYTPGKSLLIADTLSRHPLAETEQSDLDEEVEVYIASVEEHLPTHFKMLPLHLRAYFSQQGLLSESNGILLHGTRIVVPAKMREDILEHIHEG